MYCLEISKTDLRNIEALTTNWNNFLSARGKGIFEFREAPNWLTMSERESMLGIALRILNKDVLHYEKD